MDGEDSAILVKTQPTAVCTHISILDKLYLGMIAECWIKLENLNAEIVIKYEVQIGRIIAVIQGDDAPISTDGYFVGVLIEV